MMTDSELIELTGKYPQVMALKERYEHTTVQVERTDRITHVHYLATKELLRGGTRLSAADLKDWE